jgi:hypothetical protein
VWFDRPSAYSAKKIRKDMGWTEIKAPSKAKGRKFGSKVHDYDDIQEGVIITKPDSLENDKGLYFAAVEANFIFTRMYHYRDSQMRNE